MSERMTNREAMREARRAASALIHARLDAGWPGTDANPDDVRRLRRAMTDVARILDPDDPTSRPRSRPAPPPPRRRRRARSDLDVVVIADAPTRPEALLSGENPEPPDPGWDPTAPGEFDSTLRRDADATLPPGDPEVKR